MNDDAGTKGRSLQSEGTVSERAEPDWQVVSLADVSESVGYGYTASASTDEIGPNFLRITDIVPQRIDWESVPYCEVNERDLGRYLLHSGDIIVARTGVTVGYAQQIRTPENTVFASYLVRFRINKRIAEPRFIGHLVESEIYKKYVISQVGGAAQPNTNAKLLARFSFALPPRRVQRRIADILSAYDELIENNCRRIVLLERAARELYREWFARLRFPGHRNNRIVNGIPAGWERKTLREVAVTNAHSYLRNDLPETLNRFWNAVIISKPGPSPRLYWHQDCTWWDDPPAYRDYSPMIRRPAGTDAELDPPRAPPPARRVAAGGARQDPPGDPGLPGFGRAAGLQSPAPPGKAPTSLKVLLLRNDSQAASGTSS